MQPSTQPSTRRTSLRQDAHVAFRMAKRAAARPYRPVMVNLIVTRRCNLSCGYCFEYDKVSPPVPTELLEQRLDHLARLRTLMVTLTGGESLLHPDIVHLVAAVRERGMVPVMNTNGYLLTRDRIAALSEAGLYALQLSIDNARPNEVSKKSLKPLLPKLRLLAEHAGFRVRINTVLGSGAPREAVEVARAIVEFGFDAKVSLVRDQAGALIPLDDESRAAYREIVAMKKRSTSFLSEDAFHNQLVDQGSRQWKCRSGARYFHVCEDGLVHYCSSRHGLPGIPLADYTSEHIRRAFHQPKPCADTCTQAYAHQISQMDRLRSQDDVPAFADQRIISAASLVR